jgi:hypothetical protein
LPDAEWGGPPDHNDALPEPPQAAGWEWELDAYGVPAGSPMTNVPQRRHRHDWPSRVATLSRSRSPGSSGANVTRPRRHSPAGSSPYQAAQ